MGLTHDIWPAWAQSCGVLDDEGEVVVLGRLLQREARQRARPPRRWQVQWDRQREALCFAQELAMLSLC